MRQITLKMMTSFDEETRLVAVLGKDGSESRVMLQRIGSEGGIDAAITLSMPEIRDLRDFLVFITRNDSDAISRGRE